MAEKKNKREEVEHLRGELRQLKKQLGHYKKEAQRAAKKLKQEQALIDNFSSGLYAEPEEPEVDLTLRCTKCGSDKVSTIVLGQQGMFVVCKACSHRERKKT